MSDGAYDLADLHERAADAHVVVIGAGIGGLVAAREMVKLGIGVTVLEAADAPGGAIRSARVAGLTLDLGAESFATRGGHVARLLEDLGLADDVVDPRAGGAWVAGVPGVGAAPLPKGGILGIPANPFAADVRRVLGRRGVWRAYLDRIRPVLTIGHARSLGELVASRMGEKVRDRLVAPVTTGVYSASADDIDPDVAAPGLNEAVTRTGSLSGAVAALAAERRSAPGGAVRGLRGGMGRLPAALVDDIVARGGEVRVGVRALTIARQDAEADDREAATSADSTDPAAAGSAEPRAWRVALGDGEAVSADAVLVATEEEAARHLVAPLADGLDADPPAPGPAVAIVTLLVREDALDAAPRGTGVLTVPGSHRAKALTHTTAKWPWMAEEAGAGVHALRVSFGSADGPPATDGLSAAEAADLALAEASALLGVSLERGALIASRLERFAQSQPASSTGQAERTRGARAAIRSVPTIGAVGAWLAGTGLAQVVPDAVAEADRIRRAVLFAETD